MPGGEPSRLLSLDFSTAGVRLFFFYFVFGMMYLNTNVILLVILAEWTDPLPIKHGMKTTLRVGGLMGFVGGFLFAYQRSSCAFEFPFY